jgi:hypothetical protein
MAQFIKHVGVNGQGKKCIVVFRELPGDSDSALIIPTESLPPLYHDDLIRVIEHPNCQALMDTSDYLFRQVFNDGTNMLNTLHQRGWMTKVPTKSVAMTPKPGVVINLVDLNRELKQITNAQTAAGTRSSDIATTAPAAAPPGVITDESLAAKYRVQANQFELEVRRLREEAEKLDPKSAAAVAPVSPMQSSKATSKATSEVTKRGRGRPAKAQAV